MRLLEKVMYLKNISGSESHYKLMKVRKKKKRKKEKTMSGWSKLFLALLAKGTMRSEIQILMVLLFYTGDWNIRNGISETWVDVSLIL